MPKPRKNETRSEYVKRAIPILKKEGLSQRVSIGKAEGLFTSYKKKGRKRKKITGWMKTE